MHQSTRKIKPLSELVGDRIFTLPMSMANDIDTVTGDKCLFVGINGKATYVPVGKPIPIAYNVFCVLKDLGMLDYYKSFEEGQEIV